MAARKSAARKLPPAPPQIPRQTELELLAPGMRLAVLDLLAIRAERFHDGRRENDVDAVHLVFETLRSNKRQKFLYGQGRDYAGKIVTNAYDASWSWHGHGMAIDIVHPTLWWKAPEAWWEQLAVDAEYVGLYPGRRFKRIPDSPHLQWRGDGKFLTPLSPTPMDRADHRANRTIDVWKRYGLVL